MIETQPALPAISSPWQIPGLILAIVGIIGILIRIIVPSIPHIIYVGSLNQISSVCNSPIGAMFSGNKQLAAACTDVGYWMIALNVAGVGGLILAIVGGAMILKTRS